RTDERSIAMPVPLTSSVIAPLIGDNTDPRRRKIRPRPGPPPYLPDVAAPNPQPLPTSKEPSTISPPPLSRPSRAQEMNEARDVYLKQTPGRFKSAAKGALEGFLGGGGLIGAGMGAIYGAADPRGLRESEFNQRVRPQILERFGYEDQAAAAQ